MPDAGVSDARYSTPPLTGPTESNLAGMVADHYAPLSPRETFFHLQKLSSLLINGGNQQSIDATVDRNGIRLTIQQASLGQPITITHGPTPTASGKTKHASFTYHANGNIDVGVGTTLTSYNSSTRLPQDLSRVNLQILSILGTRAAHQSRAISAHSVIDGQLRQLQPSSTFDNKISYSRIAVIRGQALSAEVNLTPGIGDRNSIQFFHETPQARTPLFTIHPTGAIRLADSGTAHPLPNQGELALLTRFGQALTDAQKAPAIYQDRLNKALAKLQLGGTSIRHSDAHGLRPSHMTNAANSSFELKTTGDILRALAPISLQFPGTDRFQKRFLWAHPRGSIRRRMLLEALRSGAIHARDRVFHNWGDNTTRSGRAVLFYEPSGAQQLTVYRRPSGASAAESARLWDILRIEADGTHHRLSEVAKRRGESDAELLNLPRHEQLQRASQYLRTEGRLRPLQWQPLPRFDFTNLTPASAEQAYEKVADQLRSRNIHFETTAERSVSSPLRDNRFTIRIPNSDPFSVLEITERRPGQRTTSILSQTSQFLRGDTPPRRVIIRMWQASRSTHAWVFDNRHFNPRDSINLPEEHLRMLPGNQETLPWHKRLLNDAVRVRSHPIVHGGLYALGYFSGVTTTKIYEKIFWSPQQREILGTPLPELSRSRALYELGAFLVPATSSGIASVMTDGLLNYTGGLYETAQKWRISKSPFGAVLSNHPPKFFTSRVGIFPISTHGFHTSHIIRRGTPLLAWLTASELYHNGGSINSDRLTHNLIRVGGVSTISSSLWSITSHYVAKQAARNAFGNRLTGLAGFLTRRRLLREVPSRVGGAGFGLTMRSNIMTIALEMAILSIWESRDRKEEFAKQEPSLRHTLARTIERLNDLICLLEKGEAILPQQIRTAYQEVESAYRQYHRFLEIIGREDKNDKKTPKSLSLASHYEWANDFKLIQLKRQDQSFQQELLKLQGSYGIVPPNQNTQESLSDFAQTLSLKPDKTEQITTTPLPTDLTSPDGKSVIHYLQEELNDNPNLFNQPMRDIAKQFKKTFSGWNWTQTECIAFFHAVLEENQRRIEHFRTPLLSPKIREAEAEKWIRFAKAEAALYRRYESNNTQLAQQEYRLSEHPDDLLAQLKDYRNRIDVKLGRALTPYLKRKPSVLTQVI